MSTGGSQEEIHDGGCLCGAVRYRVSGPLRPVINCHCTQCRKLSGHHVAATAAPRERMEVTEERGLKWYRSSEKAQRGFCGECGSSLFWSAAERDYIAIMAGTLDGATGLETTANIYCGSAGDYYALDPDLPAHAAHGASVMPPDE